MARKASLPAMTAVLERFAALEGEIALIEAARCEALARANAEADKAAADLLTERARLAGEIEAWWAKAGPALTGGERKSIELGGCMVGTRLGKPSLQVPADARAAIDALAGSAWGRTLVRVTKSFDRRAISGALAGPKASRLADLGFAIVPGEESFILERVSQEGSPTA